MFKNQQKRAVFLLPYKDIKNTQEIHHQHLNKKNGKIDSEDRRIEKAGVWPPLTQT